MKGNNIKTRFPIGQEDIEKHFKGEIFVDKTF